MIDNESDLIDNLSKNVKKIMAEQKISMKKLAERTGLSFSVIRNIRDRKVKKLNAQNIYRLAVYFHISPNQLLGTDSIPAELNITEERVEFLSSFFEKEAGDFIYHNKCQFLEDYDSRYEECVVNTIHSFIEAYKMAAGYYYEAADPAKTKSITKDAVDKEYLKYVLSETLHKEEGKEEHHVKDERAAGQIPAAGKAVRRLRESYGITRKELGLRTGLGEDCIYRIESGINKKINYQHMNLIARELLCTPDFLLGESCDPASDRYGSAVFYPAGKGLVFRHVQLGHDLAYAWNYMDAASKDVVISMIHTLNMMYRYKKVSKDSFGRRLSVQEVFFREQDLYRKRYKNRGAHFYTQKYTLDKGE